jgi:hypothetical protein
MFIEETTYLSSIVSEQQSTSQLKWALSRHEERLELLIVNAL